MSPALLACLRRHLPLLVLLPLALGLMTLTQTGRSGESSHVATSGVYVSARATIDDRDFNRGALYVQRQIPSLTALAGSSDVLDPVIAELELSVTSSALAKRVSVDPGSGSILQVSVQGDSAGEALALSNAISASLAAKIEAVTPRDASGEAAISAQALTASSMVEPAGHPSALAAFAALAGFILAVAITLYRYATNRRLNSADDVREITTAPVLAELEGSSRIGTPRELAMERLAYGVRNAAINASVDTVVVADTTSGRHASRLASDLARALSFGRSTCAAIDRSNDVSALVARARIDHDLVLVAWTRSRGANEPLPVSGARQGLLAVVECGHTAVSSLIDLLQAAETRDVDIFGVVTVSPTKRYRLSRTSHRAQETSS